MAKTSLKVKSHRKPKFEVREYPRCERCGRPHAVFRKFKLCRLCFRELANKGQIPGVSLKYGNTLLSNTKYYL